MKIIGASVVFVCDRDFSIIRDGGVVYEGERIVEVGVYKELVAKYTFPQGDSVLGRHSPDCPHCRAVTTAKVAPTLQCGQSKQSPTAIPRILEKHKQAGRENSTLLESTFENNTQKVDSGKQAQTLSNSAKDSRISKETSAIAERCPLFCDEKSVFSSDWQGSYLEGNDRRQSRRIADLSRKAQSTSQAESPQTEFFSGCVLLPSLINAHIHFEFSSNSTSFVYGSFEGWLASVMSKRDDVLADMDSSIESTIEEQLDSGVGSVGAISSYGADMQALAQSALKVVYFSEAIGANPAALDMLLADFKARFLAARALASRSFFPAIALHAPYSVHSVLAKHIIAFAKETFDEKSCIKESSAKPATQAITNPCETSCTLSAHFLESNAERLWLESKNDADAPKGWFYDFYTQTLKIPRPAPYYTIQEFMELFSSTRASFVHCTTLNSLESTFLAQGGHSLITCPRSNRLLDGSMLDLKKLDSRQNLGIGTDGASSNANTNMLDELRAGLFGMEYDLQDLARVLLLAATRGGAKALGLANGTLESGRSADMAVFAIDGIIDSTQPEVHFILLANKVHRLLINGEQVR